ncbi:cytidylyltransferase domain-containing protein [Anaerovibrio lipolyticus]|uniref:acylneuraminate cytidylyltransferase family protein n=1 Tax=Anaerovibrio lipolyticus TaxID=82374 RepID=UPI0004833E91|nr:acylneuraminate cytidylyltransferase family protein [Anaerovibrio lipolyticus]
MKNIAIIPARSGSKGLKNKNIKLLNGKPLMWYSIQAAIKSDCFDEVMVSTDSAGYAEIAKECGANVPFLRSAKESTDTASSWDVVREVLANYQDEGKVFDNVMLLQPTSPLRTDKDIVGAFNLMQEKKASTIIGVCETDHSPLWCNILPEDGSLNGFIRPEAKSASGRQGLPTYYRINGAIYLTKAVSDIGKDLYNNHCFAYIMPRNRSIDIDTELDFKIAEALLK